MVQVDVGPQYKDDMYQHVLARLAMCFLDDIVKVGILFTTTITSTILHCSNVVTREMKLITLPSNLHENRPSQIH